MGFEIFELGENLLKGIQSAGYESPTPIQSAAIPFLMKGSDLIGQAQTGTGKTAAFALPILSKLTSQRSVQALIMAPTRELAIQVADAVKLYSSHFPKIKTALLYGGQPIGPQFAALNDHPAIVIGTPGRIIDHVNRGSLKLSELKHLVLDEADEMLRMGFIEDVEYVLSHTPEDRQTILFSATMPPEILRITQKYLKADREWVKIEGENRTSDDVEQSYWLVYPEQKFEALTYLLEMKSEGALLVFAKTRKDTTEITDMLQAKGYHADALNGEMTQNLREAVIKKLRDGRLKVVVATDIAARGLDIQGVSCVVNYDIPQDSESYIHRIGRTGRAGKQGEAILLVSPKEKRSFFELTYQLKQKIKQYPSPTPEDILKGRENALKENLRDLMDDEHDMVHYQKVLTELAEEGYDQIAVATAALRLACQHRQLNPSQLPKALPQLSFDTPKRKLRCQYGNIFIRFGIGRSQQVKAKDMIDLLVDSRLVRNNEVGLVRVDESETFVELPKKSAESIVAKADKLKLFGQVVDCKIYGAEIDEINAQRSAHPSQGRNDRSFNDRDRNRSYGRPAVSTSYRDQGQKFDRSDRSDRGPRTERTDRPERGDRTERSQVDKPFRSFDRSDRAPKQFDQPFKKKSFKS